MLQKNSHILLISPFICSFFSFSPMEVSVTDFSAPIGASVFKFCVHLQDGKVYMEIKMLILILLSFFKFLFCPSFFLI